MGAGKPHEQLGHLSVDAISSEFNFIELGKLCAPAQALRGMEQQCVSGRAETIKQHVLQHSILRLRRTKQQLD